LPFTPKSGLLHCLLCAQRRRPRLACNLGVAFSPTKPRLSALPATARTGVNSRWPPFPRPPRLLLGELPVKPLGFSIAVIQSPFPALTSFLVHKGDLLKARVIIYAYQQVRLLFPSLWSSNNHKSTRVEGVGIGMLSLEPICFRRAPLVTTLTNAPERPRRVRAIGSNDDVLQLNSRVIFANGVFDRAKTAGASPSTGVTRRPIA
jgi:hypothetical protein